MKRFDLGIVIAAVALVAGGLGFIAGHYTAGKVLGASTSAGSGPGGGHGGASGGYDGVGGGGGFRRGSFGARGTVTGVSGNTITITDLSGATKTVNVSSSTSYFNGADRSSSSLADVGSTILASGQTASDGSLTASRIIINPPNPGSFGGGSGGAPSASTQVN